MHCTLRTDLCLVFACRYDYLEFTDASGAKSKYDGEVGSERWPKRVEFKGQRLHMHFYSDSSNNEWGYKFTVSGNILEDFFFYITYVTFFLSILAAEGVWSLLPPSRLAV